MASRFFRRQYIGSLGTHSNHLGTHDNNDLQDKSLRLHEQVNTRRSKGRWASNAHELWMAHVFGRTETHYVGTSCRPGTRRRTRLGNGGWHPAL